MEQLLRQVAAVFENLCQPWALVGGIAVSVRTEPRFTRDIDLAVAVDDDRGAEALVFAFQSSGYRTIAIVEQEATRRLATARLRSPQSAPFDGLVLDLLFASSGIEPEICAEAEPMEVFPEMVLPVATFHHLIILKVLSRDDRTRPQDVIDLRQLIQNADEAALEAARQAARLIASRGYDRSRNLSKDLNAVWDQFRCVQG